MLITDINHMIEINEHRIAAAKSAAIKYNNEYNFDDIASAKDFFAICFILSAQMKAISIEKFVTRALGGEHVPATANRGDFRINDVYYESKMSTTNAASILNIRQVRLYQNVDFYVCGYIDELELKNSHCFILSKQEMADEIERYGSFSHGTKNENKIRTNSEYSLSVKIGSDMMKRWEKQYHYEKLYQTLING